MNFKRKCLIIGVGILLAVGFVVLYLYSSFLIALIALFAVISSVVILTKPELGLYILAVVVPIGRYTIPGLPFQMTAADVIIIVIFVSWLLRKLAYEKRYAVVKDKMFIFLALFTIFSGLSILNSQDKLDSFFEFIQTIEYFIIIPYLIFDLTKDVKQIKNILWILVSFGGLFSLYGLYQGVALGMRATSIAGHPNAFGIYLAMIIPIVYSLFLVEKRKANKVLLISMLVLCGGCLLTTLSRAGWLAAFLGILFINIKLGIKRSLMAGLVVLLIFTVIGFFYMPEQVKSRFETFTSKEKDTSGGRIEQYENAFDMIKAHPLLGVGLNEAIRYNEVTETEGGPKIRAEMHNFYLAIASERGLIALVFFLIFVFMYLSNLWRSSSFSNIYGVYLLAMFAASLSFLLGNLFHNSVGRGNGNLFMMIVGMVLALHNISRAYEKD
jgi:O-antigen ligase